MRPLPIAASLALPPIVHANCARDVADARSALPRLKDPAKRRRAEAGIARAQRELVENEEFDCESAIVPVQKMLK